jgi:uncharacterized protein YkwD
MRRTIRLPLIKLTLLAVAAAASQAVAQTQYSIGNPTNEQQYMLELINRARANGGAEATRLGLSGLQEGPPNINGEAFTIANTAQPLSWNPLLINCAQSRAKFLNDNDQFFTGLNPHTFGGTDPEQRITAAGYPMNLSQEYNGPTTASGFFPGPENVAENESIGGGPFTGARLIATILQQHNDLFTDQTVSGRGHRMTTMLTYWREIGIGVSAGSDNGQNKTWDSLYTVQNFGRQTNSTPFITGVVYQDTNGNGFYDPGEGIGGIRVGVTGANFFAVTSSSGGYSVPVPAVNASYTVTFSGGLVPTTQKTATIAGLLNAKVDFVAPVSAAPTYLANVSSRLLVQTGDNALFAGFFIQGTQQKRVIVRALGPSLGIAGQLANPTLELYSGSTLIATNDDWMNQPPADRQAVQDSIPPTHPNESALVRTLPVNPAGYSVIVRGLSNSTGIGVVEVYDLDDPPVSKLVNVSARGVSRTGNDILIGGTILLGQKSQKVVVRAIGPSLTVPGKMANPKLQLRDSNGAVVIENDNWRTGGQEVEIQALGFAPSNDLESVIISSLSGNRSSYTALVTDVNNTPGIAVVEVYALD